MALFKRTTKKAEEKAVVAVTPAEKGATVFSTGLAHILRHPHITEKASFAAEKGSYVFDVATRATKQDIEKAVFTIYKVKPRMVRIVNTPSKTKRSARTGKIGVKQRGKKAYVYLKKGESITITQ